MFGIFATPIVQPRADAFALTASVSMIAIGVTLLTMLGITFATTGAAEQASKALIEGSKDIFDWVDDLSLQGGSGGEPGDGKWFNLGAATTAGLATFVNKARELFGNSANSGDVLVPNPNYSTYGDVKFTHQTTFVDAQDCFNHTTYGETDSVTIIVNGQPPTYSMSVTDKENGNQYRTVICNGSSQNVTYYTSSNNYDYLRFVGEAYKYPKFDHIASCRWGFRAVEKNGYTYLHPFIATAYYITDGRLFYAADFHDIDRTGSFVIDGEIVPTIVNVPYQNISPYELNILYNALAEKLQTQEITFDYTEILDQMNNNADQQLQVSQDQLLEQAQIKDLLEQIKAGQGGTGKTELQESELDIPEVPHDLTWKFPFCVPFDLIALVGALNATPKDPKWEIPFHIESLGFDESITLDLTTFEPVTVVLRVVTTIAFLLGLIMVTRKMIKG